jgi:predicted ester cyclase
VPDLEVTAEDVFVSADGTRVVGRYRYEGTHTGNLLGYSPTGNPFSMRSIDIWRVEDGRVVEHWDELNTLEVFIQIGAVSPPRQPS